MKKANKHWIKGGILAASGLLILLLVGSVFAQGTINLTRWTFGGGGGTSSGGNIELVSSLGEMVDGKPVSGGDISLSSGFLSGAAPPSPTPEPEMDVKGSGTSIADGDSSPTSGDGTDFGSVNVSAGTASQTFTIENTGTAELNLTGSPKVALSGANAGDFSLSSAPASPVASGGGTTTFELTFNPSASGERTAQVSIPNNDSDEDPYDFAIAGTGTTDTTFSDVPATHWAYTWIEAIYQAGLTSGYPDGTFRPANPVTRAEMAVFIKKGIHGGSYSPPAADGSHPFTDIAGHWGEDWIEDLYDEGLTAGYPDNTFRPNNQVTRAEIAVFLLKAKHGTSYSPPAADGGVFSDIAGHWAEGWIEQLAEEGISSGYSDGTYRPNREVNRAEMAVFLVNTFSLPMP